MIEYHTKYMTLLRPFALTYSMLGHNIFQFCSHKRQIYPVKGIIPAYCADMCLKADLHSVAVDPLRQQTRTGDLGTRWKQELYRAYAATVGSLVNGINY